MHKGNKINDKNKSNFNSRHYTSFTTHFSHFNKNHVLLFLILCLFNLYKQNEIWKAKIIWRTRSSPATMSFWQMKLIITNYYFYQKNILSYKVMVQRALTTEPHHQAVNKYIHKLPEQSLVLTWLNETIIFDRTGKKKKRRQYKQVPLLQK